MINRILKIIPWVFGVILFINILLLDFWSLEKPGTAPVASDTSKTENTLNCSTCQQIISEEIQKALPNVGNNLITVTPVSTTKTISTPIPTTTVLANFKNFFIPIGSYGSTVNTDWTDAPGTDFYFNLTDYPGIKSVKWELSLQTDSANTNVYARLYDVSNKRGVDNSQLTTNLVTYEFLRSGDLTIWSGNNLYRMQIKGLNGNIVNFLSPKLKLLY